MWLVYYPAGLLSLLEACYAKYLCSFYTMFNGFNKRKWNGNSDDPEETQTPSNLFTRNSSEQHLLTPCIPPFGRTPQVLTWQRTLQTAWIFRLHLSKLRCSLRMRLWAAADKFLRSAFKKAQP